MFTQAWSLGKDGKLPLLFNYHHFSMAFLRTKVDLHIDLTFPFFALKSIKNGSIFL